MSNIDKQALTDEAISKAFAGTNFGRDDFKNILAETVIDAATGWRCGYTATTICTQLGLLTPKGCASALGLRFISEHVQRETKRLKDALEAAEKRIAELESDNAYIRNRHKELDLLIGKNILVMKAAIIEWLLKTIAELEEERDATPGAVNEDAARALAAMKLALASLESGGEACEACGGNGSVDIDHGEMGIEHIECPKCYTSQPAPVSVPDEVNVLLNHLEDVLPDDAFNLIDVKTWNNVSMLSRPDVYRAAMLQGKE